MFEEIRIENLGVIESATLELGPGLTVLSGETGAGKTMVLTGLGMLLGAKVDAALVRTGAATAVAEGRVIVDVDGPVATRALEAGAALDDDCLVIVRSMAAGAGRSRAFLGGRSVPQAVLAELAADLVTVHGQSDQIRLRTPARQRNALDTYGGSGVGDALERYRAAFQRRTEVAVRLREILEQGAERAREADQLRFGLSEIEALEPLPGEDVALAAESARLEHAEDLRSAVQLAQVSLSGDEISEDAPNAIALIDAAKRGLEHGVAHDPELASLVARAGEIGYLAADLASDLTHYLGELDADPLRLDAVNVRRADLSGLGRKYGPTTDDVIAWAQFARERLELLDADGESTVALRSELDSLDAKVAELATKLTARRSKAAIALSKAVTAELAGLAMTGASLTVAVTPLAEPGPWGSDDVEFLLTPHVGAPPRPLSKGASGGELSRVMLALEVSLAAARDGAGGSRESSGTFVFDEVDAGVGGRAAIEVGRRLAELARSTQVVVVTHLAQVAAFADRHLVVMKDSSAQGTVTATDVRNVKDDDRLRELARMLSGHDSPTAREHAQELLDLAAQRIADS